MSAVSPRDFRLFAVLLALPVLPAAPVAAEPGWIPLGPQANQRLLSLTVVPGAPSHVFAGALSGVFRASGGGSWELLDGGDGLPLGASGSVGSAPMPSSPVYLVTDPIEALGSVEGIFRSDDGGESWTRVKDAGGRLAVAPSDPSRLYLATSGSVETSRDGGATWAPSTSFPLSFQLGYVYGVAVAPSDPARVLVSWVYPESHDIPSSSVLLRSDDGGGSWEVVETSEDGGLAVRQPIFDPRDPSTLYTLALGGVYRSTDGGATWEARSTGLPSATPMTVPVDALAIDPESPSTLYAALERVPGHVQGGVYRSTDAGASWTLSSDGLPLPLAIELLAVDPADPKTVYAGTSEEGVFRSLDGGGHWAPTPALPTPTESVAFDPRTPDKLFTGGGERIFASDDGGQAWHRFDSDIRAPDSGPGEFYDVKILTIAPSDPSILFLGVISDRGMSSIPRSTDGGASWEYVAIPPGYPTELLVDPRDPSRVLVGAALMAGGVFASDQLGGGWQRRLTGWVRALERAPSNPEVLYAGAHLYGEPDPVRVCRSTDGGSSWECSPASLVLGDEVEALAVDPRDASFVLAALASGDPPGTYGPRVPPVTQIERSLDGGTTWTRIDQGLPEGAFAADLAFDPRNPETVWLATLGGGVFRSEDGGATWAPLDLGLTHPNVRELAFDASGRVLVAATGAGLFRYSTDAGPPPPPPEATWIRDPALPGFRVKVRIGQGGGATIPGTKAPACIPETICVAGALPDRAELFVRVVGPKPNGRLWPTLVKFSTSPIEVWIEQLSTGERRYYRLAGASPGVDELPGLFDRTGFSP